MKSQKQSVPACVLIVDDDEIMREAATESLTSAGFEVLVAMNGRMAVEAVARRRPDIILMDVMMPEMGGFDATRAIRQMPDGEQIPVLFMTALDDLDSINRAFEVGATDFITKPITWVILVERIRFMVRSVRMMDEQRKLQEELVQAQKMEVLGTLAGGVAHDLNNVLSGIVSYPDLLLFQLPDPSPLRKPLETIKKSGQKAVAIVQDLLTLARRGVASTEIVNLNEVVGDYLSSPEHAKCMLHHPKVRIQSRLDDQLPNIVGSPVHLSKTVMNLITNAAEAMPAGGTISIRTRAGRIDETAAGKPAIKPGDYVMISIADTGIGMSAKEKEKIFEPFYTKKKMGRSGTGLGMSVVWGTVNDHNGIVDVASVEGKGTTFRLYFPATRRQRGHEQPASPLESVRGNGETVLVVDDVEEQRDIACTMLTQLGYQVSTVDSGEKAIEYMRTHRADLILLDMIMDPGINGLETCRQVLRMHPGQRVVLTSGHSPTDQVSQAQALGAGYYLKKPYMLEALATCIQAELRQTGDPKQRNAAGE